MLLVQQFVQTYNKENTQALYYLPFVKGNHQWLVVSLYKGPVLWIMFPYRDIMNIGIFNGSLQPEGKSMA